MATLAGALAGQRPEESRLYALRLIRPTERTSFYLKDEPAQEGASGLVPLMERASELNLQIRPLSFVSADPGHDICNVAEVKGADLVLLGWHKPLLSQTVLGGTVYEVMEEAHTDVGVFIDRGLTSIRRVLVPYYGTDHDRAALGLARRLSKQTGADVTILHVIPPERAQDDPRLGVQEKVGEVFPQAGPSGQVTLKVVAHTDPAAAALEEAANGYDLVLIGVGSEWGLEQRQFGMRPEHIIQSCPASLLVVRQYDPERHRRTSERAYAGDADASSA
jgi:nucleotide-binding universal stress UspA family protein